MAEITWGQVGERFYETGLDRGVLYPEVGPGVPWNGLTSVDEDPSGGAVESHYIDGVKFIDHVNGQDYQASLEAFSAPKEFASADGDASIATGLYATMQPRASFDLSYRTLIGNDTNATRHGYKLHLVWNVTAAPSTRSNKTIAKTVEPGLRKWTLHAVPPMSTTFKPTAHLIVDSTAVAPLDMAAVEDILYGTVSTNPRMPTQAELVALLS